MMEYPLVSCITPTCNRREFWPNAVKSYLSQTYPNIEWIILDTGDPISDLLPDDDRIRYFHEPKKLHGELMNRCCELARGEFIIVVDDDDRYLPDRTLRQIEPLIVDSKLLISGTSTLYYYEVGTEKAWQYICQKNHWLASIAFRKSTWEANRFENLKYGADFRFQQKIPIEARFDLEDPKLVIATVHPGNTSKKSLGNEYHPVPFETIKEMLK